tara:strand:- start:905 stop:1225 length:321 start_codon:yes stop_codon:yes gene_type:complete
LRNAGCVSGGRKRKPTKRKVTGMIPYRVHLDDWTVAMYATDGGLTFTVTNRSEPENYMTRVVGDVRLRRYYIGEMCAGELRPSPFPTYKEGELMTKEAMLAAEGSG